MKKVIFMIPHDRIVNTEQDCFGAIDFAYDLGNKCLLAFVSVTIFSDRAWQKENNCLLNPCESFAVTP